MKNILSHNPFRVLGCLSNSSNRQIERNVTKFKVYAQINKEIESDYDFNCLNFQAINRETSNLLKSHNIISIDDNKINYSLFWFINETPFDSIGLQTLNKGNIDKALNTWKKCINDKSISENNFSIFNNLSTLLLLINLDSSKNDTFSKSVESKNDLKEAIRLKYELINSKYFKNYKESLSLSNYKLTDAKIKDVFSESLLNVLNINFDNQEIIGLFNAVDENISSNLIKEPVDNIKANINSTNDKLEENNENGLELGKKLIKSTSEDIKNLKAIVGVDNYEYQIITDLLANQIIQCGILYFNKTFDDQAYLSSYKYALSISYSEKTKIRANETIKHCEEEKGKNICSQCNTNSINRSISRKLTVYQETSRSYWNRSVQYQYMELSLHFCTDCNSKADKDSNLGCASLIGGIVLGALFGIIIDEDAWFVGAIVGLIIGFIFKAIAFPNANIEDNHPTVRKYLNQGWSLNKPSA